MRELGTHWKIHTPSLLREILQGSGQSIYKIPINMLGKFLFAVGERAAELNDPELNFLMSRMTIYSVADPESPDYDAEKLREIETLARRARAYRLAKARKARHKVRQAASVKRAVPPAAG